ncbi:hypothetical protein C8R43DRAFT_945103 [Mycena crocata]|nr:hypothetical protein C8R43DRAFT_945103 [Mycena crocata]
MSAPPPYTPSPPSSVTAANVEALLATIDRLSIADVPAQPSTPRRRSHRPHPTSTSSNQSTPPPPTPLPPTLRSPSRLYGYNSPTTSGYTHAWDVAANATQGVSGASAQLIMPHNNSPSTWSKKKVFAVFCGFDPGVYLTWAEAEAQVKGASGCLFKGYKSEVAAVAAFEYAQERSWTRKCQPRGAPVRESVEPVAIPTLPTPIGMLESTNPLHGDPSDVGSRWYIVYSGITPGVYQSQLECGLNTVGLSCATHDSCGSKEVAIARYQAALLAGTVNVVYPLYY